jgi:hypothetical protein
MCIKTTIDLQQQYHHTTTDTAVTGTLRYGDINRISHVWKSIAASQNTSNYSTENRKDFFNLIN